MNVDLNSQNNYNKKKKKHLHPESEGSGSSDEDEDTRDMEGKTVTAAGNEVHDKQYFFSYRLVHACC